MINEKCQPIFFCLMKREIGGRMRRGKSKGEQNVG
jgi:hypothetical protein